LLQIWKTNQGSNPSSSLRHNRSHLQWPSQVGLWGH
jgi:hypothetical protein